MVLALMPLGRRDEADAAVTVLLVVPAYKGADPLPCGFQCVNADLKLIQFFRDGGADNFFDLLTSLTPSIHGTRWD